MISGPGSGPVAARLAAIGQEFGHGFALDLSRIEATLAHLGRPQDRLPPIIHVAGTNGKGSTCAFARAIAEAAGLRAHVFTSPHLIKPNERVRLAGALAGDAQMLNALDRVGATRQTVTYFEAITAAAFVLFAETPADVLVLEVGLGGRLDATNVVTPAVSVITPVDMDHMAFLGDTIGQIASEKAGILKPGVPGVIARQQPDGAATIEARADAIGAPLLRAGVEWDAYAEAGRLLIQTEDRLYDLPPPALFGPHQIENAAVAAMAMRTWRPTLIDEDAIARGVSSAQWQARMQPLTRGPLAEIARARGCELWLDGGHNPHGARAIAGALATLQARARRPVVLIVGMLDRKDLDGFLAPLAGVDRLIAIPIAGAAASRAPDEIAQRAQALGIDAISAANAADALALAPDGARVLICGSLYLAGAILAEAGGVT